MTQLLLQIYVMVKLVLNILYVLSALPLTWFQGKLFCPDGDQLCPH